jgi:hypothetical protein
MIAVLIKAVFLFPIIWFFGLWILEILNWGWDCDS